MPIPWAAIAQAVQLGLQAGKLYMDHKKNNNGNEGDGSNDAFSGRVLHGHVEKEGPLPSEGPAEDSWMKRIPEIAKVMTSFRQGANPSNHQPIPDIYPVAPGSGISAEPMNIPMVSRVPFEGRAMGPAYPGSGEPDYLRLRDILARYRLR